MRIRKNYSIWDHGKLLLVLLLVLASLCIIAVLKAEQGFKQSATVQRLLETALEPVGNTMYIWGGGWNDEDSQAGAGAARIGVSPIWEAFAKQQDESYDFNRYRFQRELGLDCSGYVGWVVYNTFEEENGQCGYVTASTDMAESFAGRKWGKLLQNPKEFLPGDIVSMEGHVWICLGTCQDGSVLLVHSSPPGVSICGTPIPAESQSQSAEGINGNSIAIELAKQFMTENYPQWQENYPNRSVSDSYLENVMVMRWNEGTMRDAKKYQGMSGEEILDELNILK